MGTQRAATGGPPLRGGQMPRWLDTDTLTNQDITSALAVGQYTADADRFIMCQIFADQVQGGDAYTFFLTIQVAGAGSHYEMVPLTDNAEPRAGTTAIGGQSLLLFVRSGDVVTAYIIGVTGDDTTPDIIVRWAELAALRPTVADRALDVAATGEAGLDFDNVKAATSPTTLTNITVPNVTTVADVTGDTKQTGDAYDRLTGTVEPLLDPHAIRDAMKLAPSLVLPAEKGSIDDHLDDILTDTAEIGVAGAGLTAVTGSDGDTLETLSDQIDGLPTDQDVRDAMKLAPTAGAAAAGSVDTHLDDILADTGTDGVVVASLTTAAKALVQAEAEDALKAYDLDHLIETTAGSEEPTDGSYLDQIMHKDAGQTFGAATDSLEAIRDAMSSSTLSVVDAVDAGDLNITIAATYDGTPDGLTFSSDWAKVYFTLKKGAKAETDAEAICQIVVSATPAVTDGLLYLNGSAATALGLALTDGALTVDRAAGTCRIAIKSAATALLSPAENLAFDIKEHTTAGKDNVVGEGTADIRRTPTRAIS